MYVKENKIELCAYWGQQINSMFPPAELLGPLFSISAFPQQQWVTLQVSEQSTVHQHLESQIGLKLQPENDEASWIRDKIAPNTSPFKKKKSV